MARLTLKGGFMRKMHKFVAALVVVSTAMVIQSVGASADSGYCDVRCQLELQRQNALPRTGFYDPPVPLPWAPAGALIRDQFTTDFVVGGVPVPATRILYHTRRSDGRDVAASGVVLVPSGRPRPKDGWPVVVDAHGTSGTGRACAPSLMRDLYHGNQMVRFLQQGYVVVAPDYAGLGEDGQHELGNKVAASNDVMDSVLAARAALPALSRRWVVWGHSQGGGAALGVAERQVWAPTPGYLGAVVTAPAADLRSVADHVVQTPGLGGFAPLLAVGAHWSDPRIKVGRLLTQAAMDRLSITEVGCLGAVLAANADLTGTALVQPAYSDDARFNRYLEENSIGSRPVAGPVLLLQGEADTVIPQTDTDRLAASLCRRHAAIDYRTYPGLEHDTYPGVLGIDDGTMTDILAWTADRFAGRPVPSGC
ncbi:lipase family protein [Kribbella sp. NPDC050241]|uniref:lipase family protein n=1 Tax=Kribbella sp. NPDC050241 TaxID=3364115 RepID=UPI0037B11CD2